MARIITPLIKFLRILLFLNTEELLILETMMLTTMKDPS